MKPVGNIGPRATLKIISLEGPDVVVAAQFNPREVQVDNTVAWQPKDQYIEYTHPSPQTMAFELLFDGFEAGESVVPDILALQGLTRKMERDPRRPPKVRVIWGANTETYNLPELQAVIESVSVKFQMFSRDGQVLRATANVKLKEAALKPVARG